MVVVSSSSKNITHTLWSAAKSSVITKAATAITTTALTSKAAAASGSTTSSNIAAATASALVGVFRAIEDENDDYINPLIDALPDFTYAMPVQVIVLSVTLTLLGMLLVHLLFTIRYHLPLSKLNYTCQTSAVLLCTINVAAELQVVMHTVKRKGRQDPWMFDYIEVAIPPNSWSTGERAAWELLQGLTALVVHTTHIQFLTMLFPSEMERKLILGLLGPLALATAGLTFTSLSSLPAVNDLGDAIRNTCNSSLTLLYTFALFIWGLTLNRSRAWRTEGGTATFGSVAMILGVLGTAVNFIEIKEDRMRWLPAVVSCVLLWQSWVGFWWWVGAGMWTGEAEDVERREAKKVRRAEAKRRKREAREKLEREGLGGSQNGSASGSNAAGLRRRATRNAQATSSTNGEEIELREMNSAGNRGEAATAAGQQGTGESPGSTTGGAARPRPSRRTTQPASDGSVSSGSTPPPSNHFYSPLIDWFLPFFDRLRDAHDEAAVAKAALPPGLPDDVRKGWGIRALMLKGKRERGERRERAIGALAGGEINPGERRAGFEVDGGTRIGVEDNEDEATTESGTDDRYPPRRPTNNTPRTSARDRIAATTTTTANPQNVPDLTPATSVPVETGEEPIEQSWNRNANTPHGRSWSGFLAKWRLKDVSHF